MTKGEFIGYLIDNEIPYTEYSNGTVEHIYVLSKKETKLKKAHPRKYKDLFVPYVRVNVDGFYDGEFYIRDSGWCHTVNEEMLMNIVRKLGA